MKRSHCAKQRLPLTMTQALVEEAIENILLHLLPHFFFYPFFLKRNSLQLPQFHLHRTVTHTDLQAPWQISSLHPQRSQPAAALTSAYPIDCSPLHFTHRLRHPPLNNVDRFLNSLTWHSVPSLTHTEKNLYTDSRDHSTLEYRHIFDQYQYHSMSVTDLQILERRERAMSNLLCDSQSLFPGPAILVEP